MLNKLLAILVGSVTGVITISIVRYFGLIFFPEHIDVNTLDVQTWSWLAWLCMTFAVGSIDAGAVAALVARQEEKSTAMLCGTVLMVPIFKSFSELDYPIWFYTTMLLFIPCAWLGAGIAIKLKQKLGT